MFQLSKIASLLLVALSLPSSLMGQCAVCQTAVRAACHSETSYSICIDGKPTEDYIDCPKDFHCTGEKYICYPNAEGVPSCSRGDGVITSTTPIATTTARPPRDPDTLCKETQNKGPFINELDPTCSTYVQCHQDINTKVWSGAQQNCSPLWFNGEYCDTEKQAYCT